MMYWVNFLIVMLIGLSVSLTPNEIVIFILSQPDFIQLAQNLRSDIFNQSVLISRNHLINVHLLHETFFNHYGYWTFLTLLPTIATTNFIKSNIKWIILCEDQSKINLRILLNGLQKENYEKEIYFGHSLYDREASIIHHFAFFEHPQWFPYPMLRAGVIFSVPLIKRLTERVSDRKPATDFFIDASHELSLFIWKNMRIKENHHIAATAFEIQNSISNINATSSGTDVNVSFHEDQQHEKPQNKQEVALIVTDGQQQQQQQQQQHQPEQPEKRNKNNSSKSNLMSVKSSSGNSSSSSSSSSKGNDDVDDKNNNKILLTTASYLCSRKGYGCAIYPNNFDQKTCTPINPASIYFAIKTCKKFHNERIPAIEITWGQHAIHKNYYSDIQDDFIPTISTNIPNTETGHCTKTIQIFKLALDDIELKNRMLEIQIEWLFLSDDDTILSISGVCHILGCFNSTEDIYLGERYGYRLHSTDGFNYITGGGGIAFSLSTVRKIIKSCTCPSYSSPDDMIIGSCLQELGIKAIHSSRFHQARPIDYSHKLLLLEKPISFHKFWQIDPKYLYAKWFEKNDKKIITDYMKNYYNQIENFKNNCNYVNACSGKISSTKLKKKIKNSNGQQHQVHINSRRKLQEHSELYTTFKSKLYPHIDL